MQHHAGTGSEWGWVWEDGPAPLPRGPGLSQSVITASAVMTGRSVCSGHWAPIYAGSTESQRFSESGITLLSLQTEALRSELAKVTQCVTELGSEPRVWLKNLFCTQNPSSNPLKLVHKLKPLPFWKEKQHWPDKSMTRVFINSHLYYLWIWALIYHSHKVFFHLKGYCVGKRIQ